VNKNFFSADFSGVKNGVADAKARGQVGQKHDAEYGDWGYGEKPTQKR